MENQIFLINFNHLLIFIVKSLFFKIKYESRKAKIGNKVKNKVLKLLFPE